MTQLHGRVNGDLEEGLHQGVTFPDCCCQCPHPVVSPCRPTPPQETPQHQQVVLVQSPVRSLLLSSESWCVQGFVCACQDWRFSFPQSCRSLVIKSLWPLNSDSRGIPNPLLGPQGGKPDMWFRTFKTVGELLWYYWSPVYGSPTWQVWDLTFIMIVPLLLSCCGSKIQNTFE